MGRVLLRIAAALIVLAGVLAIFAYNRVTSLDIERITEDVHVIYGPAGRPGGLGGNTAVLRTERGAVVVDTMTFRLQGQRIRELAEKLGGGPPQAIVNTHYHIDHTHGNPAFPSGTRVVATDDTLDHMVAWDAGYWQGGAEGTLPNETFAGEHELRIGGKTIRCIHPGSGHTGGDLVVLFVEDRVLHAGDLFFNGRYPFIDIEAGGSVRGWDTALERVLALEFDAVIPGHGPVTDREGLRAFQRFVRELWQVGEEAARAGRSLEETRASAILREDAGFEVIWIPFVIRVDRDFVIGRAWEEATGTARRFPVPRAPVR